MTTRVTILPDDPIGTIAPELHGQFAEHLGELIYPGIWVGEDSAEPNIDGIRIDVVEALKPLQIPVLRWPGGCFADMYHWRDGIGDRSERPSRLNVHWGMEPEPNQVGTHEFIAFTRAIGAEPYFAGNVGSGEVSELADWIEYCNQPAGSTLAAERAANGAAEPFGVQWWGIGNENWGCGGRMTPEYYAELYSRFRNYAYAYGDTAIKAVACGPNAMDWSWTERFFDRIGPTRIGQVGYFAAHYYCGTAGTATQFDDSQWLELLTRAVAVEGIITGHRELMDVVDPDRKVGLLLDEWGTWHPVEPGKPAGGLYQQNTMRDALVAGLTLDLFHTHADKLAMANIAQLINVLQAMLLVDQTRVVKTPTYHAFAMHAGHRGATAVRLESDAPVISNGEKSVDWVKSCWRDGRATELKQVAGSASIYGDALTVTLTNADPRSGAEVSVELRGGDWSQVTAEVLAADDVHAHNTFDDPEVVAGPVPLAAAVSQGALRLDLPPGSVIKVTGVRA